jgi:hypothetical protein
MPQIHWHTVLMQDVPAPGRTHLWSQQQIPKSSVVIAPVQTLSTLPSIQRWSPIISATYMAMPVFSWAVLQWCPVWQSSPMPQCHWSQGMVYAMPGPQHFGNYGWPVSTCRKCNKRVGLMALSPDHISSPGPLLPSQAFWGVSRQHSHLWWCMPPTVAAYRLSSPAALGPWWLWSLGCSILINAGYISPTISKTHSGCNFCQLRLKPIQCG